MGARAEIKTNAVVLTYLNAGMGVRLLFETKAFWVVLTGLEFIIPLPQLLEYGDYKCVSP